MATNDDTEHVAIQVAFLAGLIVGLIVGMALAGTVLRADAQGPTGQCANCGRNVSGWHYNGSSPSLDTTVPRFYWWTCPMCHSTRVTETPGGVPGGVNPWTGHGPTAWRGGGGYHSLPHFERWRAWD